MSDDVTCASKFLAQVLRHEPVATDLTLDHGGWARTDVLLTSAARHGRGPDAATPDRVLPAPGKRRLETSTYSARLVVRLA
jgi:putative RNA 2'-phosphotransferase